MWKGIVNFFTGGGFKTVEKIALEWIETGQEKAEAAALMIKTLDPNGLMRRQLSNDVTQLYKLYIVTTLILLICEAFGIGDAVAIAVVTTKITALFVPITTLFGVIVSASFGVNYVNTKQGK